MSYMVCRSYMYVMYNPLVGNRVYIFNQKEKTMTKFIIGEETYNTVYYFSKIAS